MASSAKSLSESTCSHRRSALDYLKTVRLRPYLHPILFSALKKALKLTTHRSDFVLATVKLINFILFETKKKTIGKGSSVLSLQNPDQDLLNQRKSF